MNIYYYNKRYVTLNEFLWTTAEGALCSPSPGGSHPPPPKERRTISWLTAASPIDVRGKRRPALGTEAANTSVPLGEGNIGDKIICLTPPPHHVPSLLKFLLVLLRVGLVLQVRVRVRRSCPPGHRCGRCIHQFWDRDRGPTSRSSACGTCQQRWVDKGESIGWRQQ